MWSPDPQHLGEDHDASIFLLSVWNELFDPFTPDTFQPRLHNTASLVEELSESSSRIADASIWWKHVNAIREELKKTSDEEQDLLNLLPEYQWHLERIRRAESAREIHLTCRLLTQRHDEYSRTLIELIRNSAGELPREKHAAYKALRRLATLAIRASKEDDDVLTALPSPTVPPPTILDMLITSTLRGSQNYECVLRIVY